MQSMQGENTCLFMVGDVKQSIYRFRQANPTGFIEKMEAFSDDADAPCRRIFLQKNFRSSASVLDGCNRVFRKVMRKRYTELDYTPEAELIAGQAPEKLPDPTVEALLVDAEGMNQQDRTVA